MYNLKKGDIKMSFESKKMNIKALLKSHSKFIIPRFQRDFSWDKQNYQEFFLDLIDEIDYDDENNTFKVSNYFVGFMVLLNDDNNVADVIDGQQRLTTITILLAAIRENLKDFEDEELRKIQKDINTKYINKKDKGSKKLHGILQPKSSDPYFANMIQDFETHYDTPNSAEENLINETYKDFLKWTNAKNLIKKFKKRFDKQSLNFSYKEIIGALVNQILSCEIVSIYASDEKQASLIFENINSKGKTLTQVDLIKNYVFSCLPETAIGKDNVLSQWLEMKKKISESNSKEGSQKISFDGFILDYLKSKYPSIGFTKKNTYRKFKQEFSTTKKIKEFNSGIIKNIDLYIKIFRPQIDYYPLPKHKPIFLLLDALSQFNGKQVRIPIFTLYIRKQEEDIIKNKNFIKFLEFLANFHFAYFGLDFNLRANRLSTPFKDLTEDISNAPDKMKINEVINDFEKKLVKLIPDREDFTHHFCELEYKKDGDKSSKNQFAANYAIKAIEHYLDGWRIEHFDPTIEHIIDEDSSPKSLSIGNLTLLEDALNQNLNSIKNSNKNKLINYEDKKIQYRRSDYVMTKKLVRTYDISSFTEDDINSRSKSLAELFYDKILLNKLD